VPGYLPTKSGLTTFWPNCCWTSGCIDDISLRIGQGVRAHHAGHQIVQCRYKAPTEHPAQESHYQPGKPSARWLLP